MYTSPSGTSISAFLSSPTDAVTSSPYNVLRLFPTSGLGTIASSRWTFDGSYVLSNASNTVSGINAPATITLRIYKRSIPIERLYFFGGGSLVTPSTSTGVISYTLNLPTNAYRNDTQSIAPPTTQADPDLTPDLTTNRIIASIIPNSSINFALNLPGIDEIPSSCFKSFS